MTDKHQPTKEESLHSIALSMIGIHKELKDTRRIQKDIWRIMRAQERQTVHVPAPRKRDPFDWIKNILPI